MSNVGKTLLKGHGLRGEGFTRVNENGKILTSGLMHGRALCSCGETSEPGISISAAKRWHREHKDRVRAQQHAAGAEKPRMSAEEFGAFADTLGSAMAAGMSDDEILDRLAGPRSDPESDALWTLGALRGARVTEESGGPTTT